MILRLVDNFSEVLGTGLMIWVVQKMISLWLRYYT